MNIPGLKYLKKKPELTKRVRICPGKAHAWYETNMGFLVRKPHTFEV